MSHGYVEADDKDAIIKRLHRIEGQVRGIERMVNEERYCIDILTQISAGRTSSSVCRVRRADEHSTSPGRTPACSRWPAIRCAFRIPREASGRSRSSGA